jgi:DNA invertase Pin-like site-specific DNA recombinase
MIQMHSAMAKWERDRIIKRKRGALAAANARGMILGKVDPTNLKACVEECVRAG